MLIIEGELLHKLNLSSALKNCIVQIGNKKFHYSKIQIALLSPFAFQYFFNHDTPFTILIPSHFKSNYFLDCFEQLNSLISSTSELHLSRTNVHIFSFLADLLDNRFLMKKCKKVNSTQPQKFKLSSKMLICLPKYWLDSLNDLEFVIHKKTFKINSSLFSCV
jgi:hypothetical protein